MSSRQSLPQSTWDGISKNNGGKGRRSLPNNNWPKSPDSTKHSNKSRTRADKKRTVDALLQTSREGKSSGMEATAVGALENIYQSKKIVL